MSIEGRINVDVLFHDKSGTSSIKVLSLNSTVDVSGYPIVSFVQRTAGTAAITVNANSDFGYRDASGAIPQFANIDALLFRWSGSELRTARHESLYSLDSKNGVLAFTPVWDGTSIELSQCSQTGTYTIVAFGFD